MTLGFLAYVANEKQRPEQEGWEQGLDKDVLIC